MMITIVIANSIKSAVESRCATRNNGPLFTTALATRQEPTVAVAWIASWVTKGHGAKSDVKGDFDLRDEIEGHAWLSNKLRTFSADDTCTIMRSGTRIAKVYRGNQWGLGEVLLDLGLVVQELSPPP